MSTYELRRSGVTLCRSSIVNAGYSPQTLKDMERGGIHLYIDGKRKSRPGSSHDPKAAGQK